MAAPAGPGDSSGGMVTKLAAARTALAAGCHMVIADGHTMRPLSAIEAGAGCTWFVPSASPLSARKRWIGGILRPAGSLTIDRGAEAALGAGKSLLPVGVIAVEGEFDRGDPVAIKGPEGAELGRGLCAYSGDDGRRIMGHKSREIEAILGYRGRDEMVHRDDLVLM